MASKKLVAERLLRRVTDGLPVKVQLFYLTKRMVTGSARHEYPASTSVL
jgi:hypothetical protein